MLQLFFLQTHELAFGSFLYQLHNFVLCCSIYTTLALALERYRAVWRPVEYHNKCKGANPWTRVAYYVVPVCVFSAVFNIPKFLEVEFVVKSNVVNGSDGVPIFVNRTVASPTDLRLDDSYVILYVNAARLLVQGIIPFVLLTILNYRIYWVIKRRRQMINRPAPAASAPAAATPRISSAQRKANETQQAVVLFCIVLLFFVCHTPRFVLNVHEFLTLESLRKSIDHDCNDISLWALTCASVSHFLMTLNSSVNFVIYCFMCATFRRLLFRLVFRRGLGRLLACCCFCFRGGGGDGGEGTVEGAPSRFWRLSAAVSRLTSASPSPEDEDSRLPSSHRPSPDVSVTRQQIQETCIEDKEGLVLCNAATLLAGVKDEGRDTKAARTTDGDPICSGSSLSRSTAAAAASAHCPSRTMHVSQEEGPLGLGGKTPDGEKSVRRIDYASRNGGAQISALSPAATVDDKAGRTTSLAGDEVACADLTRSAAVVRFGEGGGLGTIPRSCNGSLKDAAGRRRRKGLKARFASVPAPSAIDYDNDEEEEDGDRDDLASSSLPLQQSLRDLCAQVSSGVLSERPDKVNGSALKREGCKVPPTRTESERGGRVLETSL